MATQRIEVLTIHTAVSLGGEAGDNGLIVTVPGQKSPVLPLRCS